MRLIVLLLAWPLIEIAVLVMVGGWIGLWPTLGIVIGTGIFGVSLLRGGGLRSVADVRGRMAGIKGRAGLVQMAQGAMTALAGFLLILPGFVGDVAGLLLLVPPVQSLVLKGLAAWAALAAARMAERMGSQMGGQMREPGADTTLRQGGDVIDGTFDVVDPDKKPTHMPSGWTRH